MFLLIQIPCRDEAAVLAATLKDLPERIEGVERIERLIIDDGSVDETVAIARAEGVEHILSLGAHRGLAQAYMAGLRAGLALGADVIVNTDADNQYVGADIGALVAPIREGRADLVVGARPILDIEDFSRTKKILQKLGSWCVRVLAGADVADAPSGFRAVNRAVAQRLFVHDSYTYTLETLIQAGRGGFRVLSTPVRVNPATRPSRLVKSNASYVMRAVIAMGRAFLTYKPFYVFAVLAASCLAMTMLAIVLGVELLAVAMATLAGVCVVGGVLANQIAANRRLIEDFRARQLER